MLQNFSKLKVRCSKHVFELYVPTVYTDSDVCWFRLRNEHKTVGGKNIIVIPVGFDMPSNSCRNIDKILRQIFFLYVTAFAIPIICLQLMQTRARNCFSSFRYTKDVNENNITSLVKQKGVCKKSISLQYCCWDLLYDCKHKLFWKVNDSWVWYKYVLLRTCRFIVSLYYLSARRMSVLLYGSGSSYPDGSRWLGNICQTIRCIGIINRTNWQTGVLFCSFRCKSFPLIHIYIRKLLGNSLLQNSL